MDNVIQMLGTIATTLAMWFLGAIVVVGLIQTAKNAVPRKLPGWLWAIIMTAIAIGVAFSRGVLVSGMYSVGGPLWEGLGIAAVSQICYESIYKGILKRGEKFAATESSAAGSTPGGA